MPRFEHLTRRQFLAGTAIAAGSAALSACDAGLLAPAPDGPDLQNALVPPVFGYADESGVRDASGYFVVGLLQTSAPQPHLDVIGDLRGDHHYLRELRYSSNDHFRVAFVRSLIEYFATAEDLDFAAGLVAPGSAGRPVPYATYYRRLLGASGAAASDLRLRLETRTSDGHVDRELADALAPLAQVTFETTRRGSELLQLADFLAGCIHGDLTFPGRVGGGKAGLIGFLKAQLGLSSFVDPRLAAPGRFRVFVFDRRG